MFETLPFAAGWPAWVVHLLSTGATVALGWLGAHVLRVVVVSRLLTLAARTRTEADDVIVREVGRRIGLWGVLAGLYLSLAYWSISPHWEWVISRVIAALVVGSVTLAVSAVATRVVASHGSRFSVPVSGLTQNIVRIVVGIFGILIILSSFNVAITPMLTALGVTGLAVALALQDPLSNFFSGLSVSLAGSIDIGDYIRLDSGAEGYVLDFKWRTTRLRQLAGNIVEVPNNKLAQAIVTNFTQPTPETGLGVEVTVSLESDLAKVEHAALEVGRAVARDVTGSISTESPTVRFMSFSETGVKCALAVRVRSFADLPLVRHELIKKIHAGFAAAGIEIVGTKP